MSMFTYDAFISYRQQEPEKSWVRNVLVPNLESEDLKIFVDHRDFRLGANLITEMTNGVEKSRYTIAVLTPSYLKSGFTEFESILAEHLSLEKSQRRLIVIMREKCKPRLSMRAKLWLDMSNDAEFLVTFPKLVSQLKMPAHI
jgi:hypothetical protein